ncbi:hypothetical protein [Streptomyces sp. NPDC003483]
MTGPFPGPERPETAQLFTGPARSGPTEPVPGPGASAVVEGSVVPGRSPVTDMSSGITRVTGIGWSAGTQSTRALCSADVPRSVGVP